MPVLSPPIVVKTRPGDDVWAYENPWTHKLFRCCETRDTCVLVCLLCPCSTYSIYKRAGENCLSCCWPMTLWSLRTKIRTLFRIQGSICGDCVAVQCCPCCALTQMHSELTRQGL